MNWTKESLDRYLLGSMNTYFDDWAEDVINNISDKCYAANEDWLNESDGSCAEILEALYRRSIDKTKAAQIIERYIKIFKR